MIPEQHLESRAGQVRTCGSSGTARGGASDRTRTAMGGMSGGAWVAETISHALAESPPHMRAVESIAASEVAYSFRRAADLASFAGGTSARQICAEDPGEKVAPAPHELQNNLQNRLPHEPFVHDHIGGTDAHPAHVEVMSIKEGTGTVLASSRHHDPASYPAAEEEALVEAARRDPLSLQDLMRRHGKSILACIGAPGGRARARSIS